MSDIDIGLNTSKYTVTKSDGSVDENAEYFVLRLDKGATDQVHVKACRSAVLLYATLIKDHLPELSKDLVEKYAEKKKEEIKYIKTLKDQVILKLGVENLNDRTYYKEQFTDTPKPGAMNFLELLNLDSTLVLGTIGHKIGTILLLTIASHVSYNFRIEGDLLLADVGILDNDNGRALDAMLDDVVFRPRMIGDVEEGGTVDIHDMVSIDAILKNEDSYKKYRM